MPFSWAPVTVLRRQPEAAERVALGVKLDEDRRLGPVTHASCPGSIATTCGATISNAQPSRYRPCTRPRARKPTCACMQYCVPTMGLMCVDQRKPRRVDDPPHPAVGGAHDVELDARDPAVLCAPIGRRQPVTRPTQR